MATPDVEEIRASSYVGFDSITRQIEHKLLKRGFQFNIIVVGQTGLGKSTLINTIFASHLIDSKGRLEHDEPVRQTTEIQTVSHGRFFGPKSINTQSYLIVRGIVISENGVRLRLNIVDTPGYGDQINNEGWYVSVFLHLCPPSQPSAAGIPLSSTSRFENPARFREKFFTNLILQDQHSAYLRKELTAQRDRYIQDTRIHCCLFFINPTGHSLRPIDVIVMKKLSEVVNVVPVIAKSDSLTIDERLKFKDRIREELLYHNIRVYPFDTDEYDDEETQLNERIRVRAQSPPKSLRRPQS